MAHLVLFSPFTDVAPNIALGFVFMVVMRLLYARFLWLLDPLMVPLTIYSY